MTADYKRRALDHTDIEVSLDKESVKRMSMEEKLNILVEIAFANHNELAAQSKIIFGNEGQRGLCEDVRTSKVLLGWLWVVFGAVSGAYFAVLTLHILRP